MTPRKPRKMPKNQRAYKTPSGKKARFRQIIDATERALIEAHWNLNLDLPSLIDLPDGSLWARTNELAKWRALRNPPTSEAK